MISPYGSSSKCNKHMPFMSSPFTRILVSTGRTLTSPSQSHDARLGLSWGMAQRSIHTERPTCLVTESRSADSARRRLLYSLFTFLFRSKAQSSCSTSRCVSGVEMNSCSFHSLSPFSSYRIILSFRLFFSSFRSILPFLLISHDVWSYRLSAESSSSLRG